MHRFAALALSLITVSAFGWTTHGPTGGSITASAVAPSNPRVYYLTTPGGIVRSDDAGASWRDVTNGIAGAQFVAVDPLDADRVYVTTSTGVARSSDGGASWTNTPFGGFAFLASGLAVDRFDSNILYAGSLCDAELYTTGSSGFYRSSDRGATWSFVRTPGYACISDLALDPLSPAIYVAQQSGHPLRSPDRAASFEESATPLPTHAIVADPRNPALRYGIAKYSSTLLASNDGGATWLSVGPALGSFYALTIDSATGRLFAGTANGLYRSGNGGQSWARVDTLPSSYVSTIIIGADSIIAGTASGVFRSTDGMATWTRVDTGDIGTSIADMATDPADPASVYVRTWPGSIFHTSDFGNSWSYLGEMPQAHLVVDAGGQLYAVLANDLYRRDGDGWDHILHLPDRIAAFVPDAQVPGTLWLRGEYQLRVTHDRGQSFEDLPEFGQSSYPVIADPRRSNILYAVSFGLFRSADGGLTWTKLDAEGVGLSYVAPPPSDASFIYTWNSDQLWHVPIGGGAATAARFPYPVYPANALVVDPRDANTLYIATSSHGIFRSADGGGTWIQFGDLQAWKLAIDHNGLVLHAGTLATGVWEQRLSKARAVRAR